jgi:hypothetical protein
MVADLHLLQNRRSVVRNGNVAVGGYQDLVETSGAEGSLDNVRNRACGKDMGLDSFIAKLTSLLPLAMSWSAR